MASSSLLVCAKCKQFREVEEFRFTENDPLRQICDVCKSGETIQQVEKGEEHGKQE